MLSKEERAARWNAGIEHLRAHVCLYGRADVPARYVVEADSYALGNWCWTQREKRRAGLLTDEQTAALDDLGFVWQPRHTPIEEAIETVERASTSGPDWREQVDRSSTVRILRHARRDGRLTEVETRRLDDLSFCWTADDTRFHRHLRALRTAIRLTGRPPEPDSCTPDGVRLGAWFARQKAALDAGSLAPERAAALREVVALVPARRRRAA